MIYFTHNKHRYILLSIILEKADIIILEYWTIVNLTETSTAFYMKSATFCLLLLKRTLSLFSSDTMTKMKTDIKVK